MFPHWIEMVSTEGQLTFRSDEAEGLYDAMSQIIWPSYGNSLEEGGGGLQRMGLRTYSRCAWTAGYTCCL
jgi:hypothetical protein